MRNIVEWGSEEIAIPYRSPIDNRVHRYFPDFYVKLKETTGKIKKYIIEVKPKNNLNLLKNQKDKQKDIFTKLMNMLAIKQNGKQQVNTVKTDCMSLR